MKTLGVFVLVSVFLAQMFSASIIVLNYEVNQSYIIENFCENTDKPEMSCNGKCHLTKQIQQDSQNKEDVPVLLTEMLNFVLSVEEIPAYEFHTHDSKELKFNSNYIQSNYSNELESLFRPPQV